MLMTEQDMAVRPLQETDLPTIHGWFQDRDVYNHIVGPYRIRSEVESLEYMRGWLTNTQNAVRLAILGAPETTGPLVGMVSLTEIDWTHRFGSYHIIIGARDDRGQGHGKRATDAILRHGFDDLGLRRVELELYADNQAAQALYEHFGFVKEGIKRERCHRFGTVVDTLIMGLLARDFKRL
ncbi:MAG: GNAT family protein [Pseudomonadota bacterium]